MILVTGREVWDEWAEVWDKWVVLAGWRKAAKRGLNERCNDLATAWHEPSGAT